nr:hypothetical protein [uncultured bacterium]
MTFPALLWTHNFVSTLDVFTDVFQHLFCESNIKERPRKV